MAELVKVVVDAMGGDLAPVEPVRAAVDAVKERDDIQVILTGQEEVIYSELKKYQDYPTDRIEVVNATEVIETAEPPVFAIRKKKDSSIVVGLKMVKEQKADAFVSSGSTGAVLVGGQVLVGRSKGVERPPLAPLIPTAKGVSLLIDCGANVDARPSHLVQFAKMGSIYMEHVVGIKNPRVAIVNNGAEEEKGNALVKETFPLLKEAEGINFIGSIEARDIPAGYADVIVCEAFVGNVILKLYEGVSSELIHKINSMPHPLALYFFTRDKVAARKVTSQCQFGGGCINDTIIHLATSEMPFGGFGESGMGGYHGREGFRTFSHYKSIVDKKTWLDLPMRYQPYRKIYEKLLRKFLK